MAKVNKNANPFEVAKMQTSINKRNAAIGALVLGSGTYMLAEVIIATGLSVAAAFSGVGIAVLALAIIATLGYLAYTRKSSKAAQKEHRQFVAQQAAQQAAQLKAQKWFFDPRKYIRS